MPKYLIVLSIVLCAVSLTYAQSDMTVLNDSAEFYLLRNPKKSRVWLEKPGANSSSEQQLRRLVISGRLEENEGYYRKSIDIFRNAIRLSATIGDNKTHSFALLRIANSQLELGLADSTLLIVEQVNSLDTTETNRIYRNLVVARYWHVLNQPAKALPYFHKALDEARASEAIDEEITALSGMASLYFSLEPNMTRVISLLNEAINLADSSRHANFIARNCARMANANMVLGNLDKAEAFLNRAKAITDITHNMPVESYVLSSFAILHAEHNDIEAAISTVQEPIRMKREMGQLKFLQNDLLNLAEWQTAVKKYSEARLTLNEGIATSTTLKDYVYLFYYYRNLSNLEAQTGRHAIAYENLKNAMAFKDSTIALQNIKAVNEIREKYETEQREKLLAEKELEIQLQRNRIGIVVASSAFVILALVIAIVLLRSRHRERLAIEKETQHKLRLQTILNTQEEVQQEIARDIHDGLVQMMGAAKLSLQAIRPGDEIKSLMEKTSRASAIIDDACTEARNISHQLLPYSLMREGFSSALRELIEHSFTTYSFDGADNIELDQEVAVNLFRISQEIVNNILKHSEATFIKVKVINSVDHISLTFEDNGKGFDPMKVKKGAGLVNIMTRAEVIGGEVNISSSPGKGSIFNISAPL